MYQVVVDEAILSEIVRRLVEALDPDKIILFGSRARGDTHAHSDVDLLIVKPSTEPHHRRVGPAYDALWGIPVPIDILWYTPEEVDDWSEVKHHVTTRATREGRVLYQKNALCPAP
jgi:predicted nucleotidyltransferase